MICNMKDYLIESNEEIKKKPKREGFSDRLRSLIGTDKIAVFEFESKAEFRSRSNVVRTTAAAMGMSIATRSEGLTLYAWIEPGPGGDWRNLRKILLDRLMGLPIDDEIGKRSVFAGLDDKTALWLAKKYMDADDNNVPPEGWNSIENRRAWAKVNDERDQGN